MHLLTHKVLNQPNGFSYIGYNVKIIEQES